MRWEVVGLVAGWVIAVVAAVAWAWETYDQAMGESRTIKFEYSHALRGRIRYLEEMHMIDGDHAWTHHESAPEPTNETGSGH